MVAGEKRGLERKGKGAGRELFALVGFLGVYQGVSQGGYVSGQHAVMRYL